ncbi:ammonium transporter [Phenylobacterium sp.]|uniref:ammonium transporter n=1 Tax=Phenylobacterium sp. TaxID=1871053 RepID=UPI003FA6EB93
MPIKLNRLAGLMLAAALLGAPAASAWAQEAPPPAEAAAPIAEAAPTEEVVTEEAVVEEVVEEEVATVDSGDTAWMLTSTALVLMMTIPGLALFYGGMVRKKNVISTVAQSFAITAVMSVLWMVVGYSLAFSENGNAALNPFVGGLGNAFLSGVAYDGVSGSIPEYLFVVFQMTFFIITPALITGAFAERMKFSAMLLFSVLWALLVYAPVCHWVWGGGFLSEEGVLDFAGGTVVHINAGVAGLVCAIVLGKRKGYGTDNMAPHNLVLTMIGASMLWVGWFGFNAGSALAANGLATVAMLNTQVATAGAVLSWMVIEWVERKKPGMLGLASGAIAGLVAITPAAGFVSPQGALIIGLVGGAAAYIGAVWLKKLLKYDDSLDVFGVHGIAGIVGAVLTGVLADAVIAGEEVAAAASPVTQFIGVLGTVVWSAVASFVILMICKFTTGLRVSEEEEVEGLDMSQHGEALH